ncbi:MAG: ComEC/Rec2 family competence protein [Candidatus Cryptobacteroides sp.]
MVEERDFAWAGIPFAAGTAAGLYILGHAGVKAAYISASLAYSATLALAVILLAGRGRSRPVSLRHNLETGLFFGLCGIFCGVNSSLCGIFPEDTSTPQWAGNALEWLRRTIEQMPFSDNQAPALIKALLTGDRSGLSPETTAFFRKAGASHILALSGLHLGIIYMFLSKATSPIGNSPAARILRYFLIVGASLAYCITTGAGPSLVRAFLFILIGESAAILHREKNPVLTLMAAMTIQLSIRPEVITSLGFQLSYLAMAGILLVYPHLKAIYPGNGTDLIGRMDPMRRIWQSAMLSVSCQLFTGPLVWFRFHTFPRYFIITNLTALPLTSAVMLLSVGAILLSAAGICPEILVRIDEYAVRTLVFCLKTIAGIGQ